MLHEAKSPVWLFPLCWSLCNQASNRDAVEALTKGSIVKQASWSWLVALMAHQQLKVISSRAQFKKDAVHNNKKVLEID